MLFWVDIQSVTAESSDWMTSGEICKLKYQRLYGTYGLRIQNEGATTYFSVHDSINFCIWREQSSRHQAFDSIGNRLRHS